MSKFDLYHGNCFDKFKQIKNESIDLILTDPPFGQNINYGRAQLGHRTIKNDNNLDWLPDFAKEAFRILKNDKWCVVFWQWRTYSKLEKIMIKSGFSIKTVGVWDKKNSGLGAGLAEQYEQVIFFKKGNAKENRFRGNVFTYSRIAGRPEHPHKKPTNLLTDVLLLCSKENDVVLDPFMGSGGTGVVSVYENRRFIGCEIDDKYFEISKRDITAVSKEPKMFTDDENTINNQNTLNLDYE